MIDMKTLVQSETIQDVACSLVGDGYKDISYVVLDRYYSRYKPEVHHTTEFRFAMRALFESQILTMSPTMMISPGVNWKVPKFRLEKKYGFE